MPLLDEPWAFERTESLSGDASEAVVELLATRMLVRGWNGPPIIVFEYNGFRYVLDGHHRVAAAKRAARAGADIRVPYELVSEAEVAVFGFRDADHVVQAICEAGPDRLK